MLMQNLGAQTKSIVVFSGMAIKTALLFRENKEFDIVKEKTKVNSVKYRLIEQWTVLLPIPSFKQPV